MNPLAAGSSLPSGVGLHLSGQSFSIVHLFPIFQGLVSIFEVVFAYLHCLSICGFVPFSPLLFPVI